MKFIKHKTKQLEDKEKSFWPEWVQRIFKSLHQIPISSMTALSTLIGVSILFAYFKSIDHPPSEFPSVILLGVAATVFCMFALAVLAIGLLGPVVAYQQYVAIEKKLPTAKRKLFSNYELVSMQLAGMGLLLSLVAYINFSCGDSVSWWGILGGVLLVHGLIVSLKLVWFAGDVSRRSARGWTTVFVSLSALTPFLMLLPLKELLQSNGVFSMATFLTLWVMAILVNALLAGKLKGLELSIFGLAFAAYLYVVMPLLSGQPSYIPTKVATFLGIRSPEVLDLRVPVSTCRLIEDEVKSQAGASLPRCSSNEWGKVRARVLSNVGDSWVLELENVKADDHPVQQSLRLTVPKEGIQIVYAPPQKTPAAACEKS
jgi:hypothetical protein